jgi:hypothetical protein
VTLRDFVTFLNTNLGVNLSMLTMGSAILYTEFGLKPSVKRERIEMTLSSLVLKVTKQPLGTHVRSISLEVSAVSLEDGADVEMPPFKYVLGAEEVTGGGGAGAGAGL